MSFQTPRTPVYERQAAVQFNTLPPPPPPLRTAVHSAPRRNNAETSPSLVVIPVSQSAPHQSTPLSAVLHHNSFSPIVQTPVAPSGHPASRGTSPMASRSSPNFGVPYDPRDWASGDLRANQARRVQQQQHRNAEDGLTSPPPPYSPQDTAPASQPGSSIVNSSEIVGTSFSGNPAQGPTAQGSQNIVTRPPQRSTHATPASNRHSIHLAYPIPPPPPPPTNSASRQNPHAHLPRGMPYTEHTLGDTAPAPAPSPQPPAARRAVSANAGYSTGGHFPPRSSSSSRGWHPGLPLPGPPPGPPPPSSRSQSMSVKDRAVQPGTVAGPSRARFGRHTVHDTDLGPIPPTPADWTESTLLPSARNLPAEVNINDNYRSQHTPPDVSGPGNSTQVSPLVLTRSPAVRDSSVQGLRERRQHRNSQLVDSTDVASLFVQTDGWSDALNHPVPTSGRTIVGPSSAGRIPSGRSKALSPLANVLAGTTEITDSPVGTETSSFSPLHAAHAEHHTPRANGLSSKSLPTPPLSYKAPLSASSPFASSMGAQTPALEMDSFMQDALRRHADFLEKEKNAATDSAKLQLFSTFIINEASIRFMRYRSAIDADEFDVRSVREQLFSHVLPQNSAVAPTADGSASTKDAVTSTTGPPTRQDTYWKDYQPALSPIASMEYDEMGSRGRAPSRWWESQTGSQPGDRDTRVRRSKRESKYMGLSKEFLMAHSPNEEFSYDNASYFPATNGYPSEKADPATFGYYDDDELQSNNTMSSKLSKAPATPQLFDISRFITLPPPYPRHYPAVNNNHPDLADYRTTVRTLSDLDEVRARKARHLLSVEALQADLQRRVAESRRIFRANIQAQIQEGSITYAEAVEAEEAQKIQQEALEKQSLQAEFDTMQDVVINPLHDLLNGRLEQLNAHLQRLQDDLRKDARHQDPDGPQGEGDETPELLEKLTQLKWLFDTREQIHKECFSLMSERNDKFMAIVLLPHQQGKNSEKIRETESFFEKDTQSRYATHCAESFERHKSFLQIIDEHVQRGVELQSSAFWDIAPGLLDLLQKIPDDLSQLPRLQIPAKEYEENPTYYDHPQQYLYSLLTHAEKSTYQFIEGQVNLHCLLHEAKSGLLASKHRWMDAHDRIDGANQRPRAILRDDEETKLTVELKQKAGMIEEQWLEALGSALQGTRERVKAKLQQENAWEKIALDDA